MKVGAVIGQDGKTVASLADGVAIRVWDTETGEVSETANPALNATSGRRIAAVQELLSQGAEAVVAPPGAFCQHSHKVAQSQGLKFLEVAGDTNWEELHAAGKPASDQLVTELPAEQLAQGHHHHH